MRLMPLTPLLQSGCDRDDAPVTSAEHSELGASVKRAAPGEFLKSAYISIT
jgi:hypothetical protein